MNGAWSSLEETVWPAPRVFWAFDVGGAVADNFRIFLLMGETVVGQFVSSLRM